MPEVLSSDFWILLKGSSKVAQRRDAGVGGVGHRVVAVDVPQGPRVRSTPRRPACWAGRTSFS